MQPIQNPLYHQKRLCQTNQRTRVLCRTEATSNTNKPSPYTTKPSYAFSTVRLPMPGKLRSCARLSTLLASSNLSSSR